MVAIAPLLLIYLPQPDAAVLVCAWVVAFFPVLANTTLGLNSVDHNLARPVRACRRVGLAGADGAACASGAAVFARRPAHRRRACADSARWWLKSRRVRPGQGSGLAFRIAGVGLSPQHPADVCGSAVTLAHRHRHLRAAVDADASRAAPLARERHRSRDLNSTRQLHRPRRFFTAITQAIASAGK